MVVYRQLPRRNGGNVPSHDEVLAMVRKLARELPRKSALQSGSESELPENELIEERLANV